MGWGHQVKMGGATCPPVPPPLAMPLLWIGSKVDCRTWRLTGSPREAGSCKKLVISDILSGVESFLY